MESMDRKAMMEVEGKTTTHRINMILAKKASKATKNV